MLRGEYFPPNAVYFNGTQLLVFQTPFRKEIHREQEDSETENIGYVTPVAELNGQWGI